MLRMEIGCGDQESESLENGNGIVSPTCILLMADGSADGQSVLSHLHANYRVIESHEKSEIFAAAMVERPDLIVADLDLPGRIGFEAIEMLRKHPSLGEIPIIGLSDRCKRSDVLAAVRVGVNDYLIKKVTTADSLILKVECWLTMLSRQPDGPGGESDTGCLTDEEAQIEDSQLCLTDAIINPLLRYSEIDEGFSCSDNDDSAQNQLSMKNWINPFIVHTANVFRKMLGWRIERLAVDIHRESFQSL